jgi:hypothetical protein
MTPALDLPVGGHRAGVVMPGTDALVVADGVVVVAMRATNRKDGSENEQHSEQN